MNGRKQKASEANVFKASCLEKMFAQKGEKRPRLRLAGFEGDWTCLRFCDCMSMLANNTLSRACLTMAEGGVSNVHYGDVLIKYGAILDANKTELPKIRGMYNIAAKAFLHDGDVIFADTAEDEMVGKCCELRCDHNRQVVSGLHTIPCRPNFTVGRCYLGYYFNSGAFHSQLLSLMQGTKVISITRKSLGETMIHLPPTVEEQEAIGKFFEDLDKLIELQAKKVEKLRNIKAGCLERMFG